MSRPLKNRYQLRDIIHEMSWSGSIWAVGCKTEDAARIAYQKRAPNAVGVLMLCDLKSGKLIVYDDENIIDPVGAAKYWFADAIVRYRDNSTS